MVRDTKNPPACTWFIIISNYGLLVVWETAHTATGPLLVRHNIAIAVPLRHLFLKTQWRPVISFRYGFMQVWGKHIVGDLAQMCINSVVVLEQICESCPKEACLFVVVWGNKTVFFQ